MLCFNLTLSEIEIWEEDDSEIDEDIDTLPPQEVTQEVTLNSQETSDSGILLKWIVFFVMVFQSKFCLSDRALQWVLKLLHLIFNFESPWKKFEGSRACCKKLATNNVQSSSSFLSDIW